jgi:hypothetical protein
MTYKLYKLRAFINGIVEFRSHYTTWYADWGLMLSYDSGREWAHKLTFRRYE